MSAQAKESNALLDLSGKTAVITGGTQGIGEGVAIRFAQLGASRIFIVGRNEEKGNAVLERLREAAVARSGPGHKQQFEFLRADLSTIKTVTETATDLRQKVNKPGIDYLVMTQGGPPNGLYEENSEGFDKSFAVQCLSRFGLTYLLAESKTLAEGSSVVSVLSPGSNYAELDIEDLSLKRLNATHPWRPTMLVSQGKRDSTVTDAITLEFNHRYPSIRFYHLFPGYVLTSAPANRGFPFPIPQLGSIFGPILAKTVGHTAMGFSDIPIYLAANSESRKLDGFMFNERLNKVEPGHWAQNPTHREKIFEKLRTLFESKK